MLSPAALNCHSSGGKKTTKNNSLDTVLATAAVNTNIWPTLFLGSWEREALPSWTLNMCFSLVLGSLSFPDRRLYSRFNLCMYWLRLIPPSSLFHAPAGLIFKTLPTFASRQPPQKHTHSLFPAWLLSSVSSFSQHSSSLRKPHVCFLWKTDLSFFSFLSFFHQSGRFSLDTVNPTRKTLPYFSLPPAAALVLRSFSAVRLCVETLLCPLLSLPR